jgi:hypothetical protein
MTRCVLAAITDFGAVSLASPLMDRPIGFVAVAMCHHLFSEAWRHSDFIVPCIK